MDQMGGAAAGAEEGLAPQRPTQQHNSPARATRGMMDLVHNGKATTWVVGVVTTTDTSAMDRNMASQANNTRVEVPNSEALSGNIIASQEVNDATSPNPLSGRDGADRNITERKLLLKCKKLITASTFNARTIRETSRKQELLHSMFDQRIDILGIQEHRFIHSDPLKYEKIGGYTIITASAWRNDMMAATGGIGIIISQKAMKSLSGVTIHGNRNLIVNFTSNPKTSVIVTYSPTNTSSEDEIDKYYKDLRGCIDSIPAHNFLVLLGDFNARFGKDDAKYCREPPAEGLRNTVA